MATKQLVTKVWIAPGCIVCDACETEAPDVFEVKHDEGTCLIRPAALEMEFTKPRTQTIMDAATGCPVDVIKFTTVAVEVSDAEAAAAPAAAVAGDDKAPSHASAKSHPDKPAKPKIEGPKITDPAIQALLDAATTRGGKPGMGKSIAGGAPASIKRLASLPADQLPPDARQSRTLEKTRPEKAGEPTRRDLVLAGAWTVFGLGVGVPSAIAFNRFLMPNVLEEPDPKVRIGVLDRYRDMAPGDVIEDFKNSGKFWIIRDGNNRIAAVSIVCTHLGCVPTWLPNERKYKCPCHGSGYKQDGTNFEGPTPRPLERFKIYLDGNNLIVDRSKKFLAMGPNDTSIWNDPDSYIEV